jgi:hypothetical protein
MPRFVILEHDHPELHWDFMLEVGGVLQTWRLPTPPRPGQTVPADMLFDHRTIYLDYEGPVSGNRGHVTRWDAGTYSWSPADKGAEGRVAVRLDGRRLHGTAYLDQDPAGDWTLTFAE